ncbi:MAG: phosphotransferase [Dermatophilaceae bacterium]
MTRPSRPMNDPLTSAYPVLDAARLSELVEAEVCAGGLRHKPGRSTSASLLSRRTGRPLGWVQILLGHQPEKIANARRRASRRGLAVQMRDLPEEDGVLLHGPVDTDPQLHRGLATIAPVLPDLGAAIAHGEVEVLRYNALRRLVLRGGEPDTSGHLHLGGPLAPTARPGPGVTTVPTTEVIRVSAARRGPGLRAAAALATRGIPVGAAVLDPHTPTSRYVTVWPWIDGVDLAHAPDPDAAADAAAALAAIHVVADSVGGQRIWRMLSPGDPPRHRVARIVTDVLAIAPDLAGRILPLLERLPEPAWDVAHIVHGDFSADQVIRREAADSGTRDQSGGITIIDLDRVRLGDPHEDLGCFAAAELRRTGGWGLLAHLVEAYPRPVRRGSLHAWTLHALVMRLLEPFRGASPTWRSELSERLDEIEQVLTDGVLS